MLLSKMGRKGIETSVELQKLIILVIIKMEKFYKKLVILLIEADLRFSIQ